MKRLLAVAAFVALVSLCACAQISIGGGTMKASTSSPPVSFRLTVSTDPGCGPPFYKCSSQSTAVAVVPPLPNLPSVNSTGYAYSTPSDFYYPAGGIGNCITDLSDITSRSGISLNASWSGGASNFMWSTDRAYGSAADSNGNVIYFHVHYDANGCMQMDSNMSTTSLSGGTGAGFTMSRHTPATAYKVTSKSADGTKTALYQENLTGTSTVSVTRTFLFDYNNCPGVDGTMTSQGGNGNLGVSDDDRYYITTLNFPPALAGQNGAHWVLAWDRTTNSCTTYYTGIPGTTESPANGNIWSWCVGNCSRHGSNPAPLALNTTCDPTTGYGLHGNQIVHNGLYIDLSGPCNGNSGSFTLWKVGTNTINTCNPTLNDCGGHGADGYSTFRTMSTTYAIHQASDPSIKTVITLHNPVGMDFHGSVNWAGANADLYPELLESQEDTSALCNTVPYCIELIAARLDGTLARFSPSFHIWRTTGDLGPIAVMTQDGYCMIFQSDWNNTRGTDANGSFRTDLFAICNLK